LVTIDCPVVTLHDTRHRTKGGRMKGRHSTGRDIDMVQLVRVFLSLLGTAADFVGEQRHAPAHLALRCGMLAGAGRLECNVGP
jgi:hypothetical protein